MKNIEVVAKEIIEKGFDYIGVRTLEDDENYNVGDTCRESYEWDIENDCSTYHTTGLTAGGTCATRVEYDSWSSEEEDLIEAIKAAIESNDVYVGRKVIIAGEYENTDFGYGDEDEIRIEDAEVIAYINE